MLVPKRPSKRTVDDGSIDIVELQTQNADKLQVIYKGHTKWRWRKAFASCRMTVSRQLSKAITFHT